LEQFIEQVQGNHLSVAMPAPLNKELEPHRIDRI
jgi:hypothetical protein